MSGSLGPLATGRRVTALAVLVGVVVAVAVDGLAGGLGGFGRALALAAGLLVVFAVLVAYYALAGSSSG
jgi:hypothetical protein